jgi:large subunit ribosomal protein L10
MKQSLFVLGLAATATAFTGPVSHNTRPETSLFGGGRGGSSTLDGKKKTVASVKELLDSSEMIITVPASGIKVSQVQKFRRECPQGTTVRVVKNKLMSRAIEGTDYEAVGDMLKGANMWFFIEEDIGGTVKAWNAFCKTAQLLESHQILGGNIEGTNYDFEGVTAISKLPTKKELIAQIAGGIKAVPTKLARVVKAPGMKVARAIKLAGDEIHGITSESE